MKDTKERINLYLYITFGLSIVSGILIHILDKYTRMDHTMILSMVGLLFMGFPTIAAVTTIKITREKNIDLKIKPKLKENYKYYIQGSLIPGILVSIGAIIYFILFRDRLDINLLTLKQYFPRLQGLGISINIKNILVLSLAGTILAPLVIVNHVLALGEELGWRGYLLYKQIEIMDTKKAVILNGVLWGLAHVPLIYYGLHYGVDYPLYPLSGVVVMIVFTTTLGIILSYLTIKTDSVLPASIAHGAINALKGIPVLFSLPSNNQLLGPGPAGLVGGIGVLAYSIYLYTKLPSEPRNK